MPNFPVTSPRPVGQVLPAVVTIGPLSLLLCGGLAGLGVIERINRLLPGNEFKNAVPTWVTWWAIVVLVFLIPWVLLNIQKSWQRWVLWVSVIVIGCAWIPVLSLAAIAPKMMGPLVAAIWAGLCGLVYGHKHHLPCEAIQATESDEAS